MRLALSSRGSRRRRGAGFTLLELLLVMALVALISAMVVPRVGGWIDSARHRTELDALRSRLAQQPVQGFHAGVRTEWDARSVIWALPAGWQIELASPLVWESNGMAAGGRLQVRSGDRVLADWVVTPISGEVREATAADGPFSAAQQVAR